MCFWCAFQILSTVLRGQSVRDLCTHPYFVFRQWPRCLNPSARLAGGHGYFGRAVGAWAGIGNGWSVKMGIEGGSRVVYRDALDVCWPHDFGGGGGGSTAVFTGLRWRSQSFGLLVERFAGRWVMLEGTVYSCEFQCGCWSHGRGHGGRLG